MAMEQEGTHSDPAQDWGPQGQDTTALEGSMWRVGLEEQSLPYPERPGEPDCIYYLRTGFCGYADRCRFNHPRDRPLSAVVASGRGSGGDYPERAGQPICQYYMRTGSCKFGTSCKYHHPRQGPSSVSPFALNVYGYPLRPGEKECNYYIKTGQCKFGMTCKFHHPPPSNVPVAAPSPAAMSPAPLGAPTVYSTPTPAPQQYGVVAGNWPVARPSMVPGSYIPGPYGPMLLSPGVVPFPGWAPYPGSTSVTTPNTQSVGAGQFYGLMPLSPSAPTYSGSYQALPSTGAPTNISKEHSYPQRPGQPECQHYLKTGECKFGSSCKYHHPTEWVVPEPSSTLSPMGLPLRPGTPICSYYAQHGVCKFGPSCKFDHPMGTLSYSPSASSLSDMPVAPYPVGSSIGTLAPSSSSSDLRADVTISGHNKDSSATLSTSVSVSSGSGRSVLSKSGSISQSGLQQSSQSSGTSSSVKDSEGQGGTPS